MISPALSTMPAVHFWAAYLVELVVAALIAWGLVETLWPRRIREEDHDA